MKRLQPFVLLALALMVRPGGAQAAVRLPAFFADHMVLQRGESIHLWGDAREGEAIEVSMAGRTARAVANSEGHWAVDLVGVPVGGPYELAVSGDNRLVVSDVLVGDVWVASGQSNMEWKLRETDDARREIAGAAESRLRFLKVKNRTSTHRLRDASVGPWRISGPDTAGNVSAVGYYFGRRLVRETGVPVGIIESYWGGTPAAAWTPVEDLAASVQLQGFLMRFEDASARFPEMQKAYATAHDAWTARSAKPPTPAEMRARPRPPVGPGHRNTPGGLFNAMIAPLTTVRIRGVIWYQGEADANRAAAYRELFPTLIRAWRREWREPDLPFLFVQLANYRERAVEPGESTWAELREAQAMTERLPHTGMAVAVDIGEAESIHPRNKRAVGDRLARIALKDVYGRADVCARGPRFRGLKLDGGKIRLNFETEGRGLRLDGKGANGFAVAGYDHQFHWADAVVEGDSVVVSSPRVPNPIAVRYAWADNPVAGLRNDLGLPAAPFRTDDWPPIKEETP